MTAPTPDEITLGGLFRLVDRFQDLRHHTGCSKSASYNVGIELNPDGDTATVILNTYDVGDWPSRVYIETTRFDLMKDLRGKIEEAEEAVAADLE